MAATCSIVLTTVPNSQTADSITATLLQERLAACVNQLPGIKSSYWWEDRINYAEEILLLIKTQTSSIKRVIGSIKKQHPYDVPEIIAVPIAAGHKPYLDWIVASGKPPRTAKK